MNQQGLNIFVDFDSTLFDNQRFAADFYEYISGLMSITPEAARSRAEDFYSKGAIRSFDFSGYIKALKLDEPAMWKYLNSLVSGNDYLYGDSAYFIQSLRSGGFDPKILSIGEDRFQKAKIMPNLTRLTGSEVADRPLRVEVILALKGDYLADFYRGKRGALVDNTPGQQLPNGFMEIHIDRSQDLDSPKAIPGGSRVSSLSQAMDVIRSMGHS